MELFDLPPPDWLKPNLAGKYDEAKQQFPCYGSPKIDGIRALGVGSRLLSRTLKPIPNAFTQMRFADCNGLDGELVVGSATDPNCMQNTSSGVMAKKGEPDVTFYVFDRWDMHRDAEYEERLASLSSGNYNVVILKQKLLLCQQDLDEFEAECIALGYEGIMTRKPKGKYKYGRSTTNEGGLTKVKRFSHSEARIVGYEELMHNDNESYKNELGKWVRPSHAEYKRESGMLGAYWVHNPEWPGKFKISCASMTHAQRVWAWNNREETIGDITRFKWFNHGIKDVPRHGIWAGFRHNDDLGKDHPLWVSVTLPTVTLGMPLEAYDE